MAVSFDTIPRGVKTPLFYLELNNSQANTGQEKLKTLLIGQMIDSGKATPNKPVLVATESKAKELFGRGSQLARMVSAYRNNDYMGELWAIPVPDPSSGTKASATLKVTGTATGSGAIYLYIGAERVKVDVTNKAKHTDISAAIKDAINAKPDLPVTATEQSGTVTVSATGKGSYGNDIKIETNRYGFAQNEEYPEGINVEVSEMSGGVGTIDLDKVIKSMKDDHYEFIVCPFNEKDDLDKFTLFMSDKSGRWSPFKQLYGHVYSAKRGEAQALMSYGKSFNDQHLTIVGVEPKLPNLTCEVLAAFVGRSAVSINNNPASPVQSLQLYGIKPYQAGEGMESTEVESLLHSGIAVNYVANGAVYICRAVTTYQRNSSGDVDESYLDSETLFTLATVVRNLRREVTSKFQGYSLVSDGQAYGPGLKITSPSEIKTALVHSYQRMVEQGLVEKTDVFAAHLIVERDENDPNRINVVYPPDLVNQLRVIAVRTDFRLEY